MKKYGLLLFLFCSQNQPAITIDSKLDDTYHNLQKDTWYSINGERYPNIYINSVAPQTAITNNEYTEFKTKQSDIENQLLCFKEIDFKNFLKKKIQKEYKDNKIEETALFSFKKIPVIGSKKRERFLKYLNTTDKNSRFRVETIFSYVSLGWNKKRTDFTAQKGVFLKKLTISINEEECVGTFFDLSPNQLFNIYGKKICTKKMV